MDKSRIQFGKFSFVNGYREDDPNRRYNWDAGELTPDLNVSKFQLDYNCDSLRLERR